jgi:hypothetical protein
MGVEGQSMFWDEAKRSEYVTRALDKLERELGLWSPISDSNWGLFGDERKEEGSAAG